MRRWLYLLLFLSLACVQADARPGKGGISSGSTFCPKGTAVADGCTGANTGGKFQDPTFFTTSRISWGTPYVSTPPWNVAGVDYPVGQYTADNALLDVATNVPAGCTLVSASRWIRCSNGVTLSHYRFNGWGIYADNAPIILDDVHFTMTADNCRNYQGIGYISTHGGTGDVTVTQGTFDFDSGCAFNADLYKQANDPGLATLSSGTASFSGTALTYSAINSGTVRIGSYISCAGCVKAMIIAGSGLNWTVSSSQGTLGPVTVTTGPVLTNMNGPISVASNSKVKLYYNANIGSGQFSSAIIDVDAKYNYEHIITTSGQHINFVVNFPQPGTIADYIQNFNTIWWDPYAEDGGTGTLDYFTASTASAANGQVTLTNFEANNNTVIVNSSIPNGSVNTNAIVRWLSQSGGAPGEVASAINYNLNQTPGSGILKVNSITLVTGGVGISPNDFVYCIGSAPTCSVPIQIVSQLTGTGGLPCPDATCDGTTGTYSVTNTVDQINKSTASHGVYKYPGKITAVNVNNNYYDATGANGVYNFDIATVPVGSYTSTGNVNMKTGASCNWGGSC